MDKWKIVVIVLLLGALGGYGWQQQNAALTPPTPDQSTPATPSPTPVNIKLQGLMSKTPPAWNIPAPLWINTPAPISLASLKGSVAIVEFWRIGCGHCREAAPFLTKMYAQYKPRGLKMVALHSAGAIDDPQNPENNWNVVKATTKELGITYPVASDEKGRLFKEAYGGTTYPTLLILDRAGKVVFIQTGDTPEKQKLLIAELEKQLKAK